MKIIKLLIFPSFLMLNLQFIFYKSYHNNYVNECIHIVFVWPIFASALTLLLHAPNLGNILGIDVNLAQLVSIYYAGKYIGMKMSGFAGFLAMLMALGSYVLAVYVKDIFVEKAWNLALGIHITSWIAQFYGHGFHEGRSPALFANLHQALFMAPLFVVMEVLFHFGYQPDFKAKCQARVDEVISRLTCFSYFHVQILNFFPLKHIFLHLRVIWLFIFHYCRVVVHLFLHQICKFSLDKINMKSKQDLVTCIHAYY